MGMPELACDVISSGSGHQWYIHIIMYCLIYMQVSKHRRTVCTHQVRDCDFKDSGCQFKVLSL